MRPYTIEEKLSVVEFLIEQLRDSRHELGAPNRGRYLILKSVAADLRARIPGEPLAACFELDEAIRAADASKTVPLGYEIGKLRRIAEILIGRWPVVRQALEKFEEDLS